MSHAQTDNDELNDELRQIEQALTKLVPAPVSARLMEDMQAVEPREGAKSELESLEYVLGELEPAKLRQDMITRLEDAIELENGQSAKLENVVPIQKHKIHRPSGKNAKPFRLKRALAAAAVLTLLSALAFFGVTKQESANSLAEQSEQSQESPALPFSVSDFYKKENPSQLVKDSIIYDITDASDRGIIISEDNVPHRFIRIDYVDRFKLKDKEGREIDFERPGADFMLIPVKTN